MIPLQKYQNENFRNMKVLKHIIMAVLMLLSSCQTNEKSNKLYEEGISLELAQLRKQEIKDLKYGLSFSIPEQKQEAVATDRKTSCRERV